MAKEPRNSFKWISCEVVPEEDISSDRYDGIILVSGSKPGSHEPEPLKSTLSKAAQLDSGLYNDCSVWPIDLPAKRLIYSPTGNLNLDYHDVRSFAEAGYKGISRALKAGVKRPLLILLPDDRFENVEIVTLLGALEALYVPLEVREISPNYCKKVLRLGVWKQTGLLYNIVKLVTALESGRHVARDIGGADPERMAPPKVEEYLADLFRTTNIQMAVISDQETLRKEYPLFACVNRAASMIKRHAGRIIFLTYSPKDPDLHALETLLFVGKGVTYDTGGVDIKCQGSMAGMSRDKCGAAACAGFMQVVNLLQPKNIKIVIALCVVRNSIGANSYVSDELITARSGMRVRIGNTDAEGRMIMADVLCQMKKMAIDSIRPRIFTVATLTGHALLSAGIGYSIAMDNAAARLVGNAEKLQNAGEVMGEPFEISRIRREDFEAHKGRSEGDDVLQSMNQPSSKTMRGHQGPAAFLIKSSGLDKYNATSERPIKYCHLDIAASAGDFPLLPTGAPILALAKMFLFDKIDVGMA